MTQTYNNYYIKTTIRIKSYQQFVVDNFCVRI